LGHSGRVDGQLGARRGRPVRTCRGRGVRRRGAVADADPARLARGLPGLVSGRGRPAGHAAPHGGTPAGCDGEGRCRPVATGAAMTAFPAAEGWSAWPAPAKLNLALQIVGRRADGYHLLQTVFRLLRWGDTIHLRLRADGEVRRVGESAPGVSEADDLVVRAANLLKKHANVAQGADI